MVEMEATVRLAKSGHRAIRATRVRTGAPVRLAKTASLGRGARTVRTATKGKMAKWALLRSSTFRRCRPGTGVLKVVTESKPASISTIVAPWIPTRWRRLTCATGRTLMQSWRLLACGMSWGRLAVCARLPLRSSSMVPTWLSSTTMTTTPSPNTRKTIPITPASSVRRTGRPSFTVASTIAPPSTALTRWRRHGGRPTRRTPMISPPAVWAPGRT